MFVIRNWVWKAYCNVPNVSEEATRNLDEHGIIRIGADVGEGDILIGKITPKGGLILLRRIITAIFGDKASDVKDASLKAAPSVQGVVGQEVIRSCY